MREKLTKDKRKIMPSEQIEDNQYVSIRQDVPYLLAQVRFAITT